MFSLIVISFAPNLSEPPISETSFCSGSKSIIGFFLLALIYAEFASSNFKTLLPNAIAANWNPKHIPRYGIFFSRA